MASNEQPGEWGIYSGPGDTRTAWGTRRIGDGLACTAWLELRGSVWEVAGLTVHAERDEVAAGPFQRLPNGRPDPAMPTTQDVSSSAPPDAPAAVTARLLRDVPFGDIIEQIRRNVRAQVPTFAPGIEHQPGRRRQPDEFYAAVAAAYVQALEAGSRSPARDIADARSYSRSMVNNWIHEARRRDLLTEAPPGRAGGELTERARALLAQENER